MNKIRSYSELIKFEDFADRLEYLLLFESIGSPTFGSNRHENQVLYRSYEWKKFRRDIIIRDHGCDLACDKFPILEKAKIFIHHINPVTLEDIQNRSSRLFDPENVICVSFETHQAIHFANKDILQSYTHVDRTPNDTCPWR